MKLSNGDMISQFILARDANVPLIAINTPDPAGTIKAIQAVFEYAPTMQWDVINGLQSLSTNTTDIFRLINKMPDGVVNASMVTGNPVEMLMKISALPVESILFMINAHMFMDKTQPGALAAPVIQAVWNTRDLFKKKKCTLVLLGPMFHIPEELQHDVVVIDEALPTGSELESIIAKSFTGSGLSKPTRKMMPNLVDATSGLAPFAVDQVVRMSITPDRHGRPKFNLDQLWHRKIAKIETTAGLKIHRTGPRFSDIGGNDNIKDYLSKVARSLARPRLVVFLDEIEKSMAAASTDTSGVTTDQLKVLLTEMQNNLWTGLIGYGFPGTGKSQLAKAFGHEAGALTVEADLGAMKHIWVGSSEARMRAFIKIIKAMGGNRVFFFATCNHVEILRPELRRRFKHGIWFLDLPITVEKEKIWPIYLKKYNLHHHERPSDEGWTGAEIEVCCDKAFELGISLKDACRYMTIVSQSMGSDGVEKMRKAASGKYVSALHPGVYTYEPEKSKQKRGFLDTLKGES